MSAVLLHTLPTRTSKLETLLRAAPDQIDPEANVTHHFAPGMYVRELLIPAGHCIVGKIHRHEHLSFLMKGSLLILTEEGAKQLDAPAIIKAPAGTKRAAYAITDVIWVNAHPNPDDESDLTKLELRYIEQEALPCPGQPLLQE